MPVIVGVFMRGASVVIVSMEMCVVMPVSMQMFMIVWQFMRGAVIVNRIMGMFVVMPMPVIVGVFMRGAMFVIVGVFMTMVIVILRIIIVGDMILRSFQFHHRVGSGNAVPLVPDKIQLPAGQAQLFQFPPEQGGIGAQINQGSQGHISGYTGETIKMQRFHGTSRRLSRSLNRSTAFSTIRARGICSRPAM
jgi:hypothetical protein